MDIEKARKLVEQTLTQDRYEHTLRVVETARDLAKRFQVPENKVALAAMLHDYAKCMSEKELRHYIEKYELPTDLLTYHNELWHGPVGAMIVKHEYNVQDSDVLKAIYYHTTGRAQMSLVEQVVFLADYIEPSRSHSGVDEVRTLAKTNLTRAVQRVLQLTIIYLVSKNVTLYPDTFFAYNYFTKKGEFD